MEVDKKYRHYNLCSSCDTDRYAMYKPYNQSHNEETNNVKTFSEIKKVIFNNPATIVIWSDDSKTVVKCENEEYDPEKGFAMAISKKALGNKGNYYETFKKWLPKEEKIDTPKLENPSVAIARLARNLVNFSLKSCIDCKHAQEPIRSDVCKLCSISYNHPNFEPAEVDPK